MADAMPADTRAKVLNGIDRLQTEALAPIVYAMRFLAAGFNKLSFRQGDAVVAGI